MSRQLFVKAVAVAGVVCVVIIFFEVRVANYEQHGHGQLGTIQRGQPSLYTQSQGMPDDSSNNQSVQVASYHRINCMVIHIAVQCTGTDQVREVVFMLRTLLFYYPDHIILHIITDDRGRFTLQTLLDTWELPNLEAAYYHMPTDELTEFTSRWRFDLHTILPANVTQVLFIDHRMRFTYNIQDLWKIFSLFSKNQMVGMVQKPGNKDSSETFYVDLLLLDLLKICHMENNLGYNHSMKWQTWEKFLKTTSLMTSAIYVLPCYWMVPLQRKFNINICLHGHEPKALWWHENIFTRNSDVEKLKEKVVSILQSGGNLLPNVNGKCSSLENKAGVLSNVDMNDACAEFHLATQLQRRTHLYYAGMEISQHAIKHSDVTLVTQLSLDRFSTLEHMLRNWKGPAVVVIHASDEEAYHLLSRVSSSSIVGKRNNVVFHVVYKGQIFYPINYLRNVGLSTVRTPYTVMIDVDLIPSPNLYERLLSLLESSSATKVAWVIPAFRAFEDISPFPASRIDLLNLIKQNKVIGYRSKTGWVLGHQPTDYKKWEIAIEPYEVSYKNEYEPYVVLPTKSCPKYDERLLERMSDKIAYGRHLNALGYKFVVLHDVFVLHLPHPLSPTTVMYYKYPKMASCGKRLLAEITKELEENFTRTQ